MQLLLARPSGSLFRSEINASLLYGLRAVAQGDRWYSAGIVEQLLATLTPQLLAPLDEACLSRAEKRVLVLLQRGLENPQIAAKLYLSEKTVRNHVSQIYQKLGLDRAAIIAHSLAPALSFSESGA